MRNVMQKAQELAEAIVDSAVYQEMKRQERDMLKDADATQALADMNEKRQRVEDILASNQMDPEELKQASLEMTEAEKVMNENPKIISLKEARKEFQTMMDNVNQILRLVVTGEVREDDTGFRRRSGGCSGSCEGCSGCS